MGFKRHVDYFIFARSTGKDVCTCWASTREKYEKFEIHIAIKFTGAKIDEIAHNKKIHGDLDVSNIRYQFNKHMKDAFTCFDARQRYTCIQIYLEGEIDFDHYVSIGVIDAHYPLHRLSAHQEVKGSIDKYFNRLYRKLVVGNWYKYAEPIHLIKKYYGERFAFQFMFFIHYQAFLALPAFVGALLFAR